MRTGAVFCLSTPVPDFVLPPPSLESSRRETPARMQAVENVGNGFSRQPRRRRVGTFSVPTRIRQHPLEVTAKKVALAKSPYLRRHLFLPGGSLAPHTQPRGHRKRAHPTKLLETVQAVILTSELCHSGLPVERQVPIVIGGLRLSYCFLGALSVLARALSMTSLHPDCALLFSSQID